MFKQRRRHILIAILFFTLGWHLPQALATKKIAKATSQPAPSSIYKKVQAFMKYSYRVHTLRVEVPGPRNPNYSIKWPSSALGLSLPVVKALQAASFDRIVNHQKPKNMNGWKKVGKSQLLYKRVTLNGLQWWLFEYRLYTSNQLYAYQPLSDALYEARGLYFRGRKPGILSVSRMRSVTKLYKDFNSLRRKLRKYPVLKVAVKGYPFRITKPVQWDKLPKGMDKSMVQLLLPGKASKRPSVPSKRWIQLTGSARATKIHYNGKAWWLFSIRGYYPGITLYVYNHASRIIYTASGSYFGPRRAAYYSIRGPILLP